MIGWALDLAIRALSGKSLDDVMRALWREAASGITPEKFQQACEAAAGESLGKFFRGSVRGSADPDPRTGLRQMGLFLEDKGTSSPWLGVQFGGDRIEAVLEGGPAWEGGPCVGDEFLAVEGYKASPETWSDWVHDLPEGAPVRITVFRRGMLREVSVPLRNRKAPKYQIRTAADPTGQQETALAEWLGSSSKEK